MSSYIFIQNKKCESWDLKVSDGKAIQTPKNTGELIERNKNPADKKRVLWGINFLFFQSIRIMYCRFELCLWPFLSISFLKAVLVYPKNIFVILNVQLNADGGLTSMTVSRSLEGCFQHRWPTMDNFLSNNKQLGVQQWMKSPIMDTYYGKQCTRVN